MTRAVLEHRYGGEVLNSQKSTIISQMLVSKDKTIRLIGGLLLPIWTDSTPFDNDTTINF